MARVFVTARPWDLHGESRDECLDALAGELGVSGLNLWVVLPPLTQVRLREQIPRVIRTRGGVCFQSNAEHYQATRCKPVPADAVEQSISLPEVREACITHGLDLRLTISAGQAGRIASAHGETGRRSAIGPPSDLSLCLVNPDVQSLLLGLVRDAASQARPDSILMTDFAHDLASELRVAAGSSQRFSSIEEQLLGLCFCESCLQEASRARVDGGEAKQFVQRVLLASLNSTTEDRQRFGQLVEECSALRGYIAVQRDSLSQLLERITEAAGCRIVVPWVESNTSVHPDLSSASTIVQLSGSDTRLPAISPGGATELLFPPSWVLRDEPPLVSQLLAAAEHGYEAVTFDEYGTLPDEAFNLIKQATRFLKRSVRA